MSFRENTRIILTANQLKRLIREANADIGQLKKLAKQGAGFSQLAELVKNDSLEVFCENLAFLLKAKDPKTVALFNEFKKGWKDYYKRVKVVEEYVPIGNLHPSQNIIYAEKSLAPVLSGKWSFNGKDAIDVLLGGAKPTINLDNPLVVCEIDGTDYIVDGHHRWSMAYAFNPNARMQAYRIVNGPFETVDDVLKFAQGSLAMRNNENPIDVKQPKDDINMYKITFSGLRGIVEKTIGELTEKKIFGDPEYQRLKLAKAYQLDDIAALCKYMMGNIKIMCANAPAGKHKREFMPQYPSDVAPDDAVMQIAAEARITLTVGQIRRLIDETTNERKTYR